MKRTLFAALTCLSFLSVLVLVSPNNGIAASNGWLGVQIQELNDALRQALDFDGEGVLVNEVFDDSPAEEAGLEAGDIITHYDDRQVGDVPGFVSLVRESEPGQEVKIRLMRKGEDRNIVAKVGERNERDLSEKIEKSLKGMKTFRMGFRPYLGVRIETLSQQLGEYFATDEGALVLSVEEESPAAEAGFRPGDVIKEIDGSRVHDTDDVFEILEHSKAGDEVKITVFRKGRHHDLQVILGENDWGKGWHSGQHGGNYYFRHGPGSERHIIIPELDDLNIELEELGDLLDDEELSKAIEKGLGEIGPMTEKKIESLEKEIANLKKELEELKEESRD